MSRSGREGLSYRTARRVVVAVLGATLLVVGGILVFTPGPAIVVLTLALTVLAAEFAWARRWLCRLKHVAADAARQLGAASTSPGAEEDERDRREGA